MYTYIYIIILDEKSAGIVIKGEEALNLKNLEKKLEKSLVNKHIGCIMYIHTPMYIHSSRFTAQPSRGRYAALAN